MMEKSSSTRSNIYRVRKAACGVQIPVHGIPAMGRRAKPTGGDTSLAGEWVPGCFAGSLRKNGDNDASISRHCKSGSNPTSILPKSGRNYIKLKK